MADLASLKSRKFQKDSRVVFSPLRFTAAVRLCSPPLPLNVHCRQENNFTFQIFKLKPFQKILIADTYEIYEWKGNVKLMTECIFAATSNFLKPVWWIFFLVFWCWGVFLCFFLGYRPLSSQFDFLSSSEIQPWFAFSLPQPPWNRLQLPPCRQPQRPPGLPRPVECLGGALAFFSSTWMLTAVSPLCCVSVCCIPEAWLHPWLTPVDGDCDAVCGLSHALELDSRFSQGGEKALEKEYVYIKQYRSNLFIRRFNISNFEAKCKSCLDSNPGILELFLC